MDVKHQLAYRKFIKLALCLILLVIGACKEKQVNLEIPKDIIAKDTMVQLLTEMHLLESSLGIRIFEERKISNTRNLLKAKIYSNYHVSKDRFLKSYDFYAKQPNVIDSMYVDVISEITKRQAEQLKK
jgi:hypothetical protein